MIYVVETKKKGQKKKVKTKKTGKRKKVKKTGVSAREEEAPRARGTGVRAEETPMGSSQVKSSYTFPQVGSSLRAYRTL